MRITILLLRINHAPTLFLSVQEASELETLDRDDTADIVFTKRLLEKYIRGWHKYCVSERRARTRTQSIDIHSPGTHGLDDGLLVLLIPIQTLTAFCLDSLP